MFWMETALSRRLSWFLCTVSHECNTPRLNTDDDVVVLLFSFPLLFVISFFLFLPVCFTDHTPVSCLGKKAYDVKA